MSLNFKAIKPAHLLSTFGQQESEEAIALALAITGDDITIHFKAEDLVGRSRYWISDFTFNGWITQHEDKSYTINQKLIDFLNQKEKQIKTRMAKGDTYREVLGMTNFSPIKIDKKKLAAILQNRNKNA